MIGRGILDFRGGTGGTDLGLGKEKFVRKDAMGFFNGNEVCLDVIRGI